MRKEVEELMRIVYLQHEKRWKKKHHKKIAKKAMEIASRSIINYLSL